MLYKHRWDQEKVFDVLKNKMEELKSWASSDTAKQAHAMFECLTHNLLLLLEEQMINTAIIRATQRTQRFIRR